MAPGLLETIHDQPYGSSKIISKDLQNPPKLFYEPGRTKVTNHQKYEHEWARPRFPDVRWEPLKEIPYSDKALRGDPNFRNLLDAATDVFDYNPKIGTEVHGVDLTNLTNAQKDDLARLISVRGVVFFRDQKNLGINAQRELGKYFGELHRHATTAVPKQEGLEDVHVVYTDEKSKDQRAFFTPTFLWHSDVSSCYDQTCEIINLVRLPTKSNLHRTHL